MVHINQFIFTGRKVAKYFKLFLAQCLVMLALAACLPRDQEPPSPPVSQTPEGSDIITLHYNERPPYLVTTDERGWWADWGPGHDRI